MDAPTTAPTAAAAAPARNMDAPPAADVPAPLVPEALGNPEERFREFHRLDPSATLYPDRKSGWTQVVYDLALKYMEIAVTDKPKASAACEKDYNAKPKLFPMQWGNFGQGHTKYERVPVGDLKDSNPEAVLYVGGKSHKLTFEQLPVLTLENIYKFALAILQICDLKSIDDLITRIYKHFNVPMAYLELLDPKKEYRPSRSPQSQYNLMAAHRDNRALPPHPQAPLVSTVAAGTNIDDTDVFDATQTVILPPAASQEQSLQVVSTMMSSLPPNVTLQPTFVMGNYNNIGKQDNHYNGNANSSSNNNNNSPLASRSQVDKLIKQGEQQPGQVAEKVTNAMSGTMQQQHREFQATVEKAVRSSNRNETPGDGMNLDGAFAGTAAARGGSQYDMNESPSPLHQTPYTSRRQLMDQTMDQTRYYQQMLEDGFEAPEEFDCPDLDELELFNVVEALKGRRVMNTSNDCSVALIDSSEINDYPTEVSDIEYVDNLLASGFSMMRLPTTILVSVYTMVEEQEKSVEFVVAAETLSAATATLFALCRIIRRCEKVTRFSIEGPKSDQDFPKFPLKRVPISKIAAAADQPKTLTVQKFAFASDEEMNACRAFKDLEVRFDDCEIIIADGKRIKIYDDHSASPESPKSDSKPKATTNQSPDLPYVEPSMLETPMANETPGTMVIPPRPRASVAAARWDWNGTNLANRQPLCDFCRTPLPQDTTQACLSCKRCTMCGAEIDLKVGACGNCGGGKVAAQDVGTQPNAAAPNDPTTTVGATEAILDQVTTESPDEPDTLVNADGTPQLSLGDPPTTQTVDGSGASDTEATTTQTTNNGSATFVNADGTQFSFGVPPTTQTANGSGASDTEATATQTLQVQ